MKMNENIENIDNIVKYWLQSAERNQKTMYLLFSSNDYSWALFLGHLVIEKTLKALFVKNFEKHAPFSHDLLRLANKMQLKLDNDMKDWLDEITTFHLNARYDNYKEDFFYICTKEYANEWLLRIEKIRSWLINQF